MCVDRSKKRNMRVAKFLRSLYDIINKEDASIIHWSHNGTAFEIVDIDKLADNILPKYFKHGKYLSFQRQLNYFGFRKWLKSKTSVCTFSHESFQMGHPEKLAEIQRKNGSQKVLYPKVKTKESRTSTSSHSPLPSPVSSSVPIHPNQSPRENRQKKHTHGISRNTISVKKEEVFDTKTKTLSNTYENIREEVNHLALQMMKDPPADLEMEDSFFCDLFGAMPDLQLDPIMNDIPLDILIGMRT